MFISKLCLSLSKQSEINQPIQTPHKMTRSLSVIANEISKSWVKPYFGAVPYLQAMHSLDSINGNYGQDSAKSIVRYFLSNATTFKGEDAKRIKLELNKMLK